MGVLFRRKHSKCKKCRHKVIPRGIIVMWSGSIRNIPKGWRLCNGTKGTPDLRDRFVLGTGTTSEIGKKGGRNSVVLTVDQLARHSHTGSGTTTADGLHSHFGRTTEIGDHRHSFTSERTGFQLFRVGGDALATTPGSKFINATEPAGGHFHDFTTNLTGVHSHDFKFDTNKVGQSSPIDIRNPFFKLAFIMKVRCRHRMNHHKILKKIKLRNPGK
ncbi:hypothetical protein [Paenibacillus roseipurpureus]|uniref:Phage tail collar domain-containing protein n=1 Tax=Paenibacillus roseopurpureus TaxID=2918901 RepID=A0AA96LMS3_9BACL|nr:hypothetical protein [Paenibacillus sp. MBLB1832]WNR43913.1 hypothetical protein MJB10_22900 [Paenibacillus sp. MBLB1832]